MVYGEGNHPITVFEFSITQIIGFTCGEFILLRLRLSEGVGS